MSEEGAHLFFCYSPSLSIACLYAIKNCSSPHNMRTFSIYGCINTILKFSPRYNSQSASHPTSPIPKRARMLPRNSTRFMFKCVCYLPFLMENSLLCVRSVVNVGEDEQINVKGSYRIYIYICICISNER